MRRNTKVLEEIADSGLLTDETEAKLSTFVDDYLSTFVETENAALTTKSTLGDGVDVDVEQEQISARKKA